MQKAVDLSETVFLSVNPFPIRTVKLTATRNTAPQDNPYRVTTSVPSFSGISYAETLIFVPQIFGLLRVAK